MGWVLAMTIVDYFTLHPTFDRQGYLLILFIWYGIGL